MPVLKRLALCGVVTLAGCSRAVPPPPPGSLPPPVDATTPLPDPLPKIAAKVNGEGVPVSHVEMIAKRLLSESGDQPKDRPFAYRRALQQLIVRELLFQEALARKLKADDARVEAAYNEARVPYPDDRAWLSFLVEQGMDPDSFRREIRAQQTIAVLLDAEGAQAGSEASDKETRAYYEGHPERFDTGERLKASHILIRVPGDATPAQREELRRKAQGLLDRIQKGADFASLARQYSGDSGSAAKGGMLEVFHRGQMVPPFEEAAYAMQPGELRLVESPFGFHVLRLHERIPPLQAPYEAVKDQIAKAVVEEKRGRRIEALVAQLWAQARIETYL